MGTLDPTLIQLSAALGAVGRYPCSLCEAADRLPLDPQTAFAIIGRAIALDLVDRDAEGFLGLSERGRKFIVEGDTSVRPFIGSPTGARRPVADTLRQRGWTAMRISGRFTVASIAILARRPTDRYPEDELRRYFRALRSAGYLALLPVRAGDPKAGAAAPQQWRLIRDTGPQAPVLRKRGTLMFDPNLGEHAPVEREARHVA
jgi:hypothetical protein